jgi:hypothetical protein
MWRSCGVADLHFATPETRRVFDSCYRRGRFPYMLVDTVNLYGIVANVRIGMYDAFNHYRFVASNLANLTRACRGLVPVSLKKEHSLRTKEIHSLPKPQSLKMLL